MGRIESAPAGDRASALGKFIRANIVGIVRDWTVLARDLPSARNIDEAQLVDHVPKMLDRIASIADGLVNGRSVPDPSDQAAEHAEERLASGFDLDEIIREYALLRACIFARFEQAKVPPTPREVALLSMAIDAAVAASVHRYAAVRDRWLKALDRIGSATLESRSLDELLERMLRVFVENTPSADVAAILLREGDRLRVRAAVGPDTHPGDWVSVAIGEGFSGTIASTRAPLAVRDASHDPLVKSDVVRRLGIRGLFGVPLLEGSELLGVAHVGSRRTPELSEHDRRLFSAMASRATTGIFHFMLRESTEQYARRQLAIADVGQRMLRDGGLDALLDDVTRTVARTLGTDLVEIAELDPEGGAFVTRAGVGWREGVIGTARTPAGTASQIGHSVMTDGGVLAHDLASERRFSPAPLVLEHGAASGVSVVIRAPGHDGRLFGALAAYSREPRFFDEDDVAFLRSMANLVASALVRARAEARTREAEERYRLIVEQAREHAMVMLDPEGRIASWSASAEDMTGWSESEAHGERLSIFYSEEDVRDGKPERLLSEARERGHAQVEGWRVRRDGTCFWADTSLTRLEDASGRLRGFADVTRDLTQRRRADNRHRFFAEASRRLSESLELDATLAALAHLCIEHLSSWCAIDLVADDGALRRVAVEHRDPNKKALAAELHTRYPRVREVEGSPRWVVRTQQAVLISDLTRDLIRQAASDEEHLRVLEALGLRSYICAPMISGGRVLGTITLGSDDPRRHHDALDLEIAEELAQRAALAIDNARLYRQSREAIEHRDEVLAVVSHDLRNPLNVVHMGATLLAENGGGALGSVRDQALRILRAAQRMNRLIQDLLDMASIERGQLALVRQPEDAAAIAREACEAFRAQAAERGVELVAETAVSRLVDVDHDRVLQVLGNLLANAVRLTPSGGSIRVSVEEQHDHALFSVRDTGPGIPSEEQPNLFHRYWRGRNVGYRGTGRGLAIAKGIVDAHGGRIWVESTVDVGTTFWFTLPFASDQAT